MEAIVLKDLPAVQTLALWMDFLHGKLAASRGIWDAVSAKDRKRKAHPILTPDSGSRFPKRPQSGKRIPL